ncbi:unnamed protein product [Rhizophagus irregularis]|nr:unnamed protein product [Rhizophagus irregularis]
MLFSYFALNRRSWKNKYEKKGRWFINLTRPKLDINAVQAAVPSMNLPKPPAGTFSNHDSKNSNKYPWYGVNSLTACG